MARGAPARSPTADLRAAALRAARAAASCVAVLGVVGVWPAPAHARPTRLVVDDPPSDDVGDGALQYPTGGEFRAGDFDLRRVELVPDGRDVLVKVTLGAPPTKPPMIRRSMATEIILENGLYVQNVDVYVDRDPGEGSSRGIPGRNIAVDLENGWDVVIVLTPQPFAARAAIESAMPEAASRVIVPAGVRAVGNMIVARVPADQLGGPPQRWWGLAAAVSGATWELSFDVMDRLLGDFRPNVFTMPVVGIAETYAFGGGQVSPYQPRVVDVLTAPKVDQPTLLADWHTNDKRYAAIPMVYPFPDDARARRREVLAARPTLADADARAGVGAQGSVGPGSPGPGSVGPGSPPQATSGPAAPSAAATSSVGARPPLTLRADAPARAGSPLASPAPLDLAPRVAIAPTPPAPPSPATPPAPPAPPGSTTLQVTDVQDNRVVLAPLPGANAPAAAGNALGGVNVWRLGVVLDEAGNVIARVVVTALYPGFATATAVEGLAQVRAGARVRFDDPPRAPPR